MKTKLLLFFTVVICLFGFRSQAQLQPGDIVVIGIGADTGNASPNTKTEFSWVPLVNLSAGTQFYFTDAGWNTLSNEFMGAGLTDEILLRYTVPAGGILAGTVQTVSENGTSADYTVLSGTKCGSDTDGKLSLPNAGDEIIVFRSTATVDASFPGTNFTAIFACTTSTLDWSSLNTTTAATATAFKDNYSNLPPGLTNGSTAVAVGIGANVSDESDNARYEGNTSGSKAVLLGRVCTVSNWKRYDIGGDLPDFNGSSPVLGWTANGVTNFSVTGADITPPVVQSIALTPAGANSISVVYTITFNESANNVSADDFQLTVTGTGVTGTIGTPSSSSGTSMTVTVSNITGTGTLRLDLKSNTNITDATGNGNNTNGYVAAYLAGGVQNVDRDSPTLTITSSATNPTNLNPIPITFTFNESVTGFDATDVVVTGGSIGSVSGSGANYTANLTPSADGAITVNVAASKATDAAGNGNTAAAQLSRTSDRTAPTVVSMNASVGNPTNANSFTLTITFSESVSNFVVGDITMGNASLSSFSGGSGSVYTVTVTPTADGAVTANIGAGVATDAAGNGNSAATQFSITVDRTAPTVSITSPGTPNPTNASTINLTITFSESVTNTFTQSELVVTGGSITSFAGNGANYVATITPSGSGTITANIAAGVANDVTSNGNTAATQFSIVSDTTIPSVSITAASTPNPTNSSSIPVTVTFSESVINFVSGDVTVGNGTLNTFSGSGTTYTFNVVPTANGTVTVDVAAGVANDSASNNNSAATQLSRTFDNVAPAFQTPGPPPGITHTSPYVENITLTEASTDFTSADIQITNGTLTGFSGSGTSYTATITPTANGTVTLSVAAGTFHDAAGNANTTTLTRNTLYDNVNPTVSITSAAAASTNANIPVTVTFSESVTNFVAGDVTVGNGSVTSFSGSGTTYTFTVVPTANGTVTVDVAAGVATDIASNTNTAATQLSRIFDNVKPNVSINSAASNPTNTASIAVTVTFSESVINFNSSDPTVGNGTINSFSGSGTTYTFNVVPSSPGTVTIDIAAAAANDAAGNTNNAATQFSIVYDNTQPTVSITSPASSPSNAASFTVNFTFSESVSNFVGGDVTVGNGSLSNFSGSGTTYSATITPTADGNVTVDVAAAVANDAAGNGNTAATQFSIFSDKTVPTLSITSTATNPTNANTIPLTFTFSESVTGFTSSDITPLGGSISAFSGSGSVYTATLTPSADGGINIIVFPNNAFDAGGNGNTSANFSITSDKTRPNVTVSSSASSPTSTSPIPINIDFSEAVIGFDVTDITVTGGGSLSGFSGSGANYTVNFTPSGNGTKSFSVAANKATDLAGNNNFASSPAFSIVYIPACSVPTTWVSDGYWSNGYPVPNQPAIILADYNTGGFDLSACSLLIASGAHVTVDSGDDVTISGVVTVQAGSTLTFEAGSNLIQSGASNNNVGSITYKRPTTMRRLDYTYWSSPVGNQNLKAFSPQTVSPPVGASRFYVLDEPTNAFVAVDPLVTNFVAGKGYNIRAPNDFPTTPAPWTGIFTGVPNNGNVSIAVTATPGLGFNMLGNPYPSTINADLFLGSNPGTIYFWTHILQGAPSGSNYASYNLTGGTASLLGGEVPNGTIQAGQGFFIEKSTAGTASFTNAMRIGNNDSQFYRTANPASGKSRIWLNLAKDTAPMNQMLLGYMEGATAQADESMDGKLIENGSALSSIIGNANYVIQARALPFDDTDIVPLNFKALTAGTYTISVDHTDGLFSNGQDVFLQDELTGIVHNIKQTPYTFASAEGTFANRFKIVYQNTTLGITTPSLSESSVVIYKNDNNLQINSGGATMQSIKIFDIRGRLIYEKSGINSNQATIGDLKAEQQVLLVQITADDQKTVTKKVVY